MKIEHLFLDKENKLSSKPAIKSGPNRGKRHPETDGKWLYIHGHTTYSNDSVKNANYTWTRKLTELGFRIGASFDDGVIGYYIFKKNE